MPNYLPCKNPSCKNHGAPHPNCHCYDNLGTSALQGLEAQGFEVPGEYRGGGRKKMAEGGEIEYFCSSDRKHKPDCQYFVDGGEVAPSWDSLSTKPPSSGEQTPDWNSLSESPPESSEKSPDWNSLQTHEQKYGTLGQKILTGVEGAGQGFAGPIATGAELLAHKVGLDTALGIDTSAEAQTGRAEENPLIHGVAQAGGLGTGLLTGTGEAGILSKGLSKVLPEASTVLGKAGSAFLKGAIENGTIQAGDELSQAMLGKGDSEVPVSSALAHIGAAVLLGGVTGGLFNVTGKAASKGLEALEDPKLASNAKQFALGIGTAAKHSGGEPISIETIKQIVLGDKGGRLKPAFIKGVEMYNAGLTGASNSAIRAASEGIGSTVSTSLGAGPWIGYKLGEKYIAPVAEAVLKHPIRGANKIIVNALTKAISEGEVDNLTRVINHAKALNKGAIKMNNAVNGIFRSGVQPAYSNLIADEERKKVKDYIENDTFNKQMQDQVETPVQQAQAPQFADGGEIQPEQTEESELQDSSDPIAKLYPEQTTQLMAAKTRINNYLQSVKPQEPVGGPAFDMKHENPMQERAYNRAIDLAIQPLSIIEHIKDGTMQAEHLKHFAQMYPELHNQLSKKITEGIMKSQQEGTKPDYKTRQGLSLFLGTPLDSTFVPQSIQAAQSVYTPQSLPPQQGKAPKSGKSASSLSKASNNYMTPSQNAEKDRSSRD